MIGSSFKERASSIPIALHLAPNSADRVLPHGAAEQSRERPAHPARVGPGKIDAAISASACFVRAGRPEWSRSSTRPSCCPMFPGGLEGHDRHRPKVPINWRSRWPCRGQPLQPAGRLRRSRQAEAFISVRPSAALSSLQEFFDEAANAVRTPVSKGSNNRPQEKAFLRPLVRRFCSIRFHGVISIGARTPIGLSKTN